MTPLDPLTIPELRARYEEVRARQIIARDIMMAWQQVLLREFAVAMGGDAALGESFSTGKNALSNAYLALPSIKALVESEVPSVDKGLEDTDTDQYFELIANRAGMRLTKTAQLADRYAGQDTALLRAQAERAARELKDDIRSARHSGGLGTRRR